MIDSFRSIARILLPFRLWIGIATFISFVLIVILINIFAYPSSYEEDIYLIPNIIVFLWLLSTYMFVGSFATVPIKSDQPTKFFEKIRFSLHRAWYHFLGFAFLGVTGLILFISSRLLIIWLR